MMSEIILSPIGPGLLLIAAGLLLRFLTRLRSPSTVSSIALGGLGAILLLLMTLQAAGVDEAEIAWWPLVTQPLAVRWILDGWNWLMLFLLLLVGLTSLLITWRLPGWRTGAYHGLSLVLLGSAAICVVSDNLLTVSGIWVATDILLIARLHGSQPHEFSAPLNMIAGSSLLIFVAVGITSLTLSTMPLSSAPLPLETMILLILAAGLRMAAYPLHLWQGPNSPARYQGTLWLVAGVGLITGGWLAGRLNQLGAVSLLQEAPVQGILALFALAAGLAAATSEGANRFVLLVSSRSAWFWLLLALSVMGNGLATPGWALVAVILSLALYALGERTLEHWSWRMPLSISAALLAGIPLLAGMPARALAPSGSFWIWLLVLLGDSLALSAVLATRNQPVAPGGVAGSLGSRFYVEIGPLRLLLDRPMIRLFFGFGLIAVPAFLWGIRPTALGELAGFEQVLGLGQLLGMMSFGRWLDMLLSFALAIGLAGLLNQPAPRIPPRYRRRVAEITSLEWVSNAGQFAFSWPEAGLRTILAIFEGEGYAGWLALLLLLAWLIFLA